MAMERIEPFGGQIDDLRAAIGAAAIINNLRGMFAGKDADMIDPRDIIPWCERESVLLQFDPASPSYDADKHTNALKALLSSHANPVSA